MDEHFKWQTGPLPQREGLFWVAGEAGGYPAVSCFRRTARFSQPFDPQNPMQEIPLVWGNQRCDPGFGHGVGEWVAGDGLPYPGSHWMEAAMTTLDELLALMQGYERQQNPLTPTEEVRRLIQDARSLIPPAPTIQMSPAPPLRMFDIPGPFAEAAPGTATVPPKPAPGVPGREAP